MNDWDISLSPRNIVYSDKRIKYEFHWSVIAYREGEGDLNYLVEEGAKFSIVFRLIRAKFWFEAFNNDIVVDSENKDAIVKGKDVFKEFQNLYR